MPMSVTRVREVFEQPAEAEDPEKTEATTSSSLASLPALNYDLRVIKLCAIST